MKAKFPTLPKHVRFSVTGGASPWVTLRLHCQGTRCQSFSREQGNIARAETSGTKGFRGNIVGKSINQERPSCPAYLVLFTVGSKCWITYMKHQFDFMGKECKIDLPASHDFGDTGVRDDAIFFQGHLISKQLNV